MHRVARMPCTVALAAAMTLALVPADGSAAARTAPTPWCVTTNTGATAAATPTLVGSPYVPLTCRPSLVAFDPAGVPTPPQPGQGDPISEDGQVVATAAGDQGDITDRSTGRTTTVDLPYARQVAQAQTGTQVTVGTVGDLAVFATSAIQGMGQEGGGPGEVEIYTASGRLLRRFSVPTHTPDPEPDTPFDAFWIQTVDHTLYLLSSDAPMGGHDAGLYRITPQGQVRGPVRVPTALAEPPHTQATFLVLPHDEMLLSDSATANGRTQAGLFRIAGDRLAAVWRRAIPGGSPLYDGGTVLTEAGGAGRASTVLAWIDLRSGRTVRRVTLVHDQLTPLVTGPFGLVAYGHVRVPSGAGTCAAGAACPPAAPAPERVVLLDPAGHIVWQAALPSSVHGAFAPVDTALVREGRHYVLSLGEVDLGVRWGGASLAPALASTCPAGFTAIGTSPPPPAPPSNQGVTGYALFDRGQIIDAVHPLVVSHAQAGQPLALTLSAVNASGQPVASPHRVEVGLGDDGAGGTFDQAWDTELVTLAAGQRALPVSYVGFHAGTYTLTAEPDLYLDPGFGPALPPFVPAGSTVALYPVIADANGVSYPLGPGGAVDVLARGPGAGSAVVPAAPLGGGLYRAVVPAGEAGEPVTFAFQVEVNGHPLGPMSASRTVMASDDAPPALGARRVSGGVALTVAAPAGGTPVGYALFRAKGTALPATSAAPVAILDPSSAGAPGASYLDPVGAGSVTYVAVALYAEGAMGQPSPPVHVR